MFAAINELYEPSSSPDDIEAWELVMMVAVCVQSAPSIPTRAHVVGTYKVDQVFQTVRVLTERGYSRGFPG